MSDIDDWLKIQAGKVRSNLKVKTKEDFTFPYMLHISQQKQEGKKFHPRIGFRQSKTEDRTVPRITVAPTLLGCIYGYASVMYDLVDFSQPKRKRGMYIYGFEFEHCLRPNEKLVYDAELTDEHWLVRYNNKTVDYVPIPLGKFFVDSAVLIPIAGRENQTILSILVEVTHEGGVPFTNTIQLEPGHWKVEFQYEGEGASLTDSSENITVKAISSSEFESLKTVRSSLEHRPPFFSQWK